MEALGVTKEHKKIIRRRKREEKFHELIYRTTFSFVKGEISEEALITVIEAFKYETGKRFRSIDFSLKINRLAYFMRHGPVSTGVADFLISKALVETTPEIIFPEKDEIKVVDLGAGHGCGTVGLCSAFNAYLQGKEVQITLVDWKVEWEEIFDTMNTLLEEENFGNVSEFFKGNEVNITYECADLKHPENNETFKRCLNEADILLLSRVLTIVELREIDIITEKIFEEMKKGAVIIFIDCIKNYYNADYPKIFKELEKIYPINKEEENSEEYEFIGAIENDFKVSKKSKAKIFVFKKN